MYMPTSTLCFVQCFHLAEVHRNTSECGSPVRAGRDNLGHIGIETGTEDGLDQFGVGGVVVGLVVVWVWGADEPSVVEQATELPLHVLQQLQNAHGAEYTYIVSIHYDICFIW